MICTRCKKHDAEPLGKWCRPCRLVRSEYKAARRLAGPDAADASPPAVPDASQRPDPPWERIRRATPDDQRRIERELWGKVVPQVPDEVDEEEPPAVRELAARRSTRKATPVFRGGLAAVEEAVRAHPTRSPEEIAEELGCSARTVYRAKERLAKLDAEGMERAS